MYVSTYTGSDYQLWSFRETKAICYYYADSRTPTHTWTEYYSTRMGYNYEGRLNTNRNGFLNDLRNSEIFVYHGHGIPGALNLDGTGDVSTSDILNLSNNALGNVKLALIYACNGASLGNDGSIFNAINTMGAKCTVAWDAETYVNHVNYWNQLFFEKIYTDSVEKEIYRGFQHADYWITDVYGSQAQQIMQYHRHEAGDITQVLYR